MLFKMHVFLTRKWTRDIFKDRVGISSFDSIWTKYL
jgi:hypothetical protein